MNTGLQISILLAVLISIPALSAQPEVRPRVSERIEDAKRTGIAVSMYRVIANPQLFDRKQIIVWGFLSLGEQSGVLWPNKTALENGGPSVDAVYLSLSAAQMNELRQFDGRWTMVEGVFTAKKNDGAPEVCGVLNPVTRVKPWEMGRP